MSKVLVFAGLLLIFVVVVGKGLLDDRLNPRAQDLSYKDNAKINWVAPKNETIEVIASDTKCSVHLKACRTQINSQDWLEVQIDPKPIKPNQPLKILVNVSGEHLQATAVDLEGLNLNMGYIRPTLTKIGANQFAGEVTLPTCDEKTMQWQALVIFQNSQQSGLPFGLKFYFQSSED